MPSKLPSSWRLAAAAAPGGEVGKAAVCHDRFLIRSAV
jgi:hypothetical protein